MEPASGRSPWINSSKSNTLAFDLQKELWQCEEYQWLSTPYHTGKWLLLQR
jgi:hypothetical protein